MNINDFLFNQGTTENQLKNIARHICRSSDIFSRLIVEGVSFHRTEISHGFMSPAYAHKSLCNKVYSAKAGNQE